MTQRELKKLLKKYNVYPKKSKGQNFLLEQTVLDSMLKAGAVTDQDLVVEVGPGFGVLTEKLSEVAKKVLAIELDKNLAELLRVEVLPNLDNVTLHEGDALSGATFHALVAWLYEDQVEDAVLDPKDESYQQVLESVDHSFKVIANLPYQITSKLLRQFLDSLPRPSQMVVMVQREVAERMTQEPGQMSLLALSAQALSTPKIVRGVPRSCFYPAPAVDSAVIHCNLLEPNTAYAKLSPKEQQFFWRLAKAGFSSKRKQLKNNLRPLFKNKTDEQITAILEKAGLSPTSRAQELSVDEWVKLTLTAFSR